MYCRGSTQFYAICTGHFDVLSNMHCRMRRVTLPVIQPSTDPGTPSSHRDLPFGPLPRIVLRICFGALMGLKRFLIQTREASLSLSPLPRDAKRALKIHPGSDISPGMFVTVKQPISMRPHLANAPNSAFASPN